MYYTLSNVHAYGASPLHYTIVISSYKWIGHAADERQGHRPHMYALPGGAVFEEYDSTLTRLSLKRIWNHLELLSLLPALSTADPWELVGSLRIPGFRPSSLAITTTV